MKKLLTTTFLVLSLLVISNNTSYAQHGPTKLGIGLVYGSEPDAAGLQGGATFRVSPEFAIAPDITVYFPDDNNSPFYDSFFAVNLNGQYIFEADTDYHIYGLGGLNVSTADYNNNVGNDSNSELGINLGIGGEYHLENFSLYGELKYVIGDYDQVVLGVGARFPIN